jgi:hypothetical protein
MFKKMISSLIIAAVSLPVFAMAADTKMIATHLQTWPWSLKISNHQWPITNTTGGNLSVKFTVNLYIAGSSSVYSDAVTLFCNKTVVVNPGTTASCTLSKGNHAQFQIVQPNFKNGADGSYTT